MTLQRFHDWELLKEPVHRTPLRRTGREDPDGKRSYRVMLCPHCDARVFVLATQLRVRSKTIESHLSTCPAVPDAQRPATRHRGKPRVGKRAPMKAELLALRADVDALKALLAATPAPRRSASPVASADAQ